MLSSFFSRSPRCGPTPFKYSMGLDNMCDEEGIVYTFLAKITIANLLTILNDKGSYHLPFTIPLPAAMIFPTTQIAFPLRT